MLLDIITDHPPPFSQRRQSEKSSDVIGHGLIGEQSKADFLRNQVLAANELKHLVPVDDRSVSASPTYA